MNQFKNFLAIDLANYGSAFAIINQFCDDHHVKVFEVSPIGRAGLLLLLIQEQTSADFLKNEILSLFKAQILSIELIKNIDPQLLSVYLSQNTPTVNKSLLFLEYSTVSKALVAAQKGLERSLQIIDFRVVRAFPLNAVVVLSATSSEQFHSYLESVYVETKTIIEQVDPIVKSYFEILKN